MKLLTVISIVLTLGACGSSSKKEECEILHHVRIHPPDTELETIYLSEIADSVHYVSIDDEQPMGKVQKFDRSGNSIVLEELGVLKLYDEKGQYVQTIGNAGKGRGEYLYPDWTLNSDTVNLVTRGRGAIFQYSASIGTDGTLMKEIKNVATSRLKNLAFESFIRQIDDNLLVTQTISQNPDLELMLLNPYSGKLIDSLPNYHNAGGAIQKIGMNSACLSTYSPETEEIFYMSIYSDTLYRITNNKIAPFLVMDYGDKKLPISITSTEMPRKEKFDIVLNSVIIKDIIATPENLYLHFVYGRTTDNRDFNRFMYVYNLKEKTGKYCKHFFTNDLDNGPNSPGKSALYHVTKGEDDYISWIAPNLDLPKKLKNVDEYKRLYDAKTEESNPIFQFIVLK